MDPLSALKTIGLPDMGSQVTNAAKDAMAGQKISIPDLKTLSPGMDLTIPETTATSGGASFSNVLGGFVQEVSDKQAAASSAVNGLLSGKNVSLHQTMISVEEANVSFQLMVEVRNRLLDSYQELMRMQV
jgi:flagellar hook-basal body complex protein FliE